MNYNSFCKSNILKFPKMVLPPPTPSNSGGYGAGLGRHSPVAGDWSPCLQPEITFSTISIPVLRRNSSGDVPPIIQSDGRESPCQEPHVVPFFPIKHAQDRNANAGWRVHGPSTTLVWVLTEKRRYFSKRCVLCQCWCAISTSTLANCGSQ